MHGARANAKAKTSKWFLCHIVMNGPWQNERTERERKRIRIIKIERELFAVHTKWEWNKCNIDHAIHYQWTKWNVSQWFIFFFHFVCLKFCHLITMNHAQKSQYIHWAHFAPVQTEHNQICTGEKVIFVFKMRLIVVTIT